MDLYGDLPPAVGEERKTITTKNEKKDEGGRQSVVGTTPNSPSRSSSRSTKSINNSKNQTGGSSAPVSFAAFKPRQTTSSKTVPIHFKSHQQPTESSTPPTTVDSQRNNALIKQATAHSVEAASEIKITASHSVTSHSATSSVDVVTDVVVKTQPSSGGITSYECTNPYDPCKPNDYLQWCEERLEQKRARQLEEENKVVLQAMEKARRELEEERQEAARSGDMHRLQATAAQGRGRGRGVTNLPAWMTASTQQAGDDSSLVPSGSHDTKAKDERVDKSQDSESAPNRKRSLFTNPSCVILLRNIANSADGALDREMREECQKYGGVKSCIVREQAGVAREDEVQVLVCFEKQESAVRAFRDLNGRYFDGRQIVASFYDEEAFLRNE